MTAATAAGQLGTRVSLDDACALLGTGPAGQAATSQAVQHVVGQVDALLREGREVTVDATSTTDWERRTWLDLAHEHDATVVAHWVMTPLGEALRRNAQRARKVPGEVIAEMGHRLAALTITTLYREGFDAVVEVQT